MSHMSRSVDLEIDLPSRKEVQAGLRVQTFERLSRVFGLTEPNLARHLAIPPATLYRRRSSGRFSRAESDRMARLARLYLRGLSVLGGREPVREWFMAPNPSLGGRKPFDLTDTDPGCVEVDRLLGRIEYGVF